MTEDKFGEQELNRPIDTEELNDLFDDAIPLEQIGKMGTVKVYNQAYVDKLQSQLTEKDKQIEELETRCNELFFQVNEQVAQIEELKDRLSEEVELHSHAEDYIKSLEAQIEKMKCCGNCKHCKYDENEESNEYCEKHSQIVNVAIQPCCEWESN